MSTEVRTRTYQSILLILFGLLLLLNVAAFLIYREAHAAESLSLQLWNYINSDAFKLLSASLILPIILFVLESKFKLAETVSKNLEERRRAEGQTRRERAERERQERRSKRVEAISQTIKWWDDLYGLSAEVTYFAKPIGDRPTIEALLKRIKQATFAGEDVVNTLASIFPKLRSDIDLFVPFFNVLLKSTITVAESIRGDTTKPQEIEALKDCLGVILQGTKDIAHHSILTVLNKSSDLLDLDQPDDEKQRLELERDCEDQLVYLRNAAGSLREFERTRNKLLATIESDAVQEFRAKCESLEQKTRNNPEKNLNEFIEFDEVEKAFLSIPTEDRVLAQRIFYSPEYVKFLADFMGLVTLQTELRQRADPSV